MWRKDIRQKHQHQDQGYLPTCREVSGVLSDRNLINVKGDSYIVFKLAGVDEIYVTPAVANMELLFTPMGEQIEVKASKINNRGQGGGSP